MKHKQMKHTRVGKGVTLAGGIAIAFLVLVGGLYVLQDARMATAAERDVYRSLDLFGRVFETVRNDYVEETQDSELIEAAIKGMLASLDPHSAYLDAETYKNMQVYTRGEFGGLGLEVTMKDGLVEVVAPIEDTPAERAGMRTGDLITHIDGRQVRGMSLSEAVELMRGAPDTEINLKVRREGEEELLKVRIVRAIIRIKAVRARAENAIGYMRITTFSERASQNLIDAIKDVQGEIDGEPIGYILDLRNNPGGLLDQAIAVTDVFLEGGEIVSTRERDNRARDRYSARRGDALKGKPMIILINGGSASASEIVAGALQDHRRAIVLGTRSFGKGSVQTLKPLGKDKGALRLTTARYYTPSGRKIQAVGVEPDILVEQKLPEEVKKKNGSVGETDLEGHLDKNKDGERSGSGAYIPKEKKEDTQLNYAIKLMRDMDRNVRTARDGRRAGIKQ